MKLTFSILRRFILLLLGGCLPFVANAQIPTSVGSDAAKVLQDNNFLPNSTRNPLQPIQTGGLPPKDGTQLVDLGESKDFQYKHANEIRYDKKGNVIYLEGDCLFFIRGYRVSSDEVVFDKSTNIAILNGHVHIDGDLFAINDADSVTINFANQSYVAKNGEAQISPELVQGSIKDKLYVKGRESYGNETMTTTLDGSVTSCNYPVPHYDIEGANIVLLPGRRIIFRKTKIRILGYVVAQIPFLSIPLDSRSSKYIPYVGQSIDEGYFAKWLIDVPTKNPHYNLETHEDFMSKLGVGLGVDYSYQSLKSAGLLSIYHVFGNTDDLTLSINHKQLFGWGTLNVQLDYEKDNYLVAPNSTTFNGKVTAVIPQGQRGTDTITLSDAETSSLGFTTSSQSLSVQDNRDFGDRLTTTTDLNYFANGSTYSSTGTSNTNDQTQRLDVNFQTQKEFNAATALLQYQRSIPIGSTATFIGGSDETPVLTVTTDGRRLLGSKLGAELPFTSSISYGDFQDPSYTEKSSLISRAFFDFGFNKVDTSQSRFKVDMNADFKQGIYSDNTAEYVLIYGTNLRYDLGQNTGINLRYNYLRPYGYSPLSIDQTGQTNYISGDLNFRPIQSLLLGAQTGYDITRLQTKDIPWQQIGLRSEFTPTKWFMLRGLFSYDTFAQSWQSLQFDLTYIPGATNFTLGATYDGEQHVWSSVNILLNNFTWGRLKSSTALSFNGYLNKFDSEQFSFTYDLHCAEAIFELQENNTGFRAGQQVAFYIRLKAIPFDTPFGVGTRGQAIGVGSGSSF